MELVTGELRSPVRVEHQVLSNLTTQRVRQLQGRSTRSVVWVESIAQPRT